MSRGTPEEYNPRRRPTRWLREPLDEQRQGKVKGRFFNANRNPITENEDIHDAAFMYKQYFDGEVGN